jgi:hypothetical protein
MKYEPLWERFEAIAPDGTPCTAQFVRAGFLTLADRPELYFFRVARGPDASPKAAEEVVVGISGESLARFEKPRRRLSREEKIDLTGWLLKENIEAGKPLDSNNLFIRDDELAALAGELGIPR